MFDLSYGMYMFYFLCTLLNWTSNNKEVIIFKEVSCPVLQITNFVITTPKLGDNTIVRVHVKSF